MSHPYVSEDHEGKPWFEWIVAAVVIVATVLAVAGYTKAATAAIAVTAIATGLVRLALRERSPWKVRSVAFDAFIGIGLGVGLFILLTMFPSQLTLRQERYCLRPHRLSRQYPARSSSYQSCRRR